MLDGMTIINMTETQTLTPLGIILMTFLVVLLFISVFAFCEESNKKSLICFCLMVVIGSFLLFIKRIPGTFITSSKERIEYQVMLDDSVSANEFLKRYHIKEQIGNSYVIYIKDENP